MNTATIRVFLGSAALCLAFAIPSPASAQTRTLRIVTYNLEDDIGGFTAPRPGLIIPYNGGTVQQGGVLEGIGEEILGNDPAQPLDILALEETTDNTSTVTPIVNGLNSFYNSPGMYAMSTTQATSSGGVATGGGPNALVYNTKTVQLLASVPVDPPPGQTLGASSGEYREVMRYEFAPAGVTPAPANEFYIYVSHYKALTGAANEAARAGEAAIIRNDEANNLPANARVLYVGDYNVTGGSSEAGYQTLLAVNAPNGIGQGQGFDPLNPSGATGIDWGADSLQYLKTESAVSLLYRDDLQLMTSDVFFGVPGGLALVPGTYHAFGNNGTTAYGASVASGNTALTNLMAGAPIPASTLYRDLTNASDHLPVVADYTIWLSTPTSTLQLGAPVNVWTYHNDNARMGVNTNELFLTPSAVTTNLFGKVFTNAVDGYIFAQPLYVANLNITNKGPHNVIFVATEHDSLYAFDADNNSGFGAAPLWKTSYINPAAGVTTMDVNDEGIDDITPEVGITGTPVIDLNTGTLYVIAKTKEISGGITNFVQRLHAVNIGNGLDRTNVVIQASVPGIGAGSSGGILGFNSWRENQRAGLVLLNGVVYAFWGSHGDIDPFHGWMLGFNATNLHLVKTLNVTPNGTQAGIWQAGGAPAADTNGNIFFMTGNGTFDSTTNNDYGDSFARVPTGGSLTVADYFTPFNQATLDVNDTDLGSGGVMLLPDSAGSAAHPHLCVGGSKGAVIYLVDRDNMGHYNVVSNQIVQTITGGLVHGYFSTPCFFNNKLYFFSQGDVIKAFAISNAVINTFPVSRGSQRIGFPSASVSISSKGATNGVCWAIQTDAYSSGGPSILRAYDARNLTNELYDTQQAANSRDLLGPAVKFSLPTIANGRVYVGTGNSLAVFGSLVLVIGQQPQSQTVPLGTSATLSVLASGPGPLGYQWYLEGAPVAGGYGASLVVTNSQATNAGNYTVVITNSSTSITSAVAVLSIIAPPAIVTPPQDVVVLAGNSATFAVGAAGTPPLFYQWKFNGISIPGATNSAYTNLSAQVANDGAYSVLVNNTYGTAPVPTAFLTVVPAGAWGDNSFGQIQTPSILSNVVAVSAGAWHNLALQTNGVVIAWGDNSSGQCSVPANLSNAVAIAAGGFHSLAVTAAGTVVGWGANDYGQTTIPSTLSNVFAIAAGTWHSVALRTDGTVAAWGDNSFGQTTLPSGLTNVTAIAADGNHSLALKADGHVIAWGENTDSQGNFVGQSVVPPQTSNVLVIAAGQYHSLVVKADGTVLAWGDDSQGQCDVPVGLTGVVALAGGGVHSLALITNGTVAAWGADWNGQLDFPAGLSNAAAVSAGEYHTVLLLDGNLPPPHPFRPGWNRNRFTVLLQTFSRNNYNLEFKTSLLTSNWTGLPSINGNGVLRIFSDSNAVSPQRFYRVLQH